MTTRRLRTRSGFTLLEVIVATTIGVLLLAALYTAVNTQIRYTSSGRDVIEASLVARSVFDRITNDILPNLGAIDPSRSQSSSSNQSSASASPSSSASGSGSSGSGASQSGASSSSSSGASSSGVNTALTFNVGVQGDSSTLNLCVSRWPGEIYRSNAGNPSDPTVQANVSDLRRISYWLFGTSDKETGMARQEVKLATSDDGIAAMNTELPQDPSFIFAPQVRSVTFQYYDPTNQAWVDQWDGTATASDGVTPLGPPAGIAITLEIALPHGGAFKSPGEVQIKTFRHVVPLQTANGAPATNGGGS
jgi:prepilin-type N-terminal cleavage/methylation domain-containing protein